MLSNKLYIFLVYIVIMISIFVYEEVKDFSALPKNVQQSTELQENKESLINSIKQLDENKKFVTLQELTDFKWDKVYQFGVFTDNKICKEIIGKDVGIRFPFKDENDEGCILFVCNDKAVCYLGTEDVGVHIYLGSGSIWEEDAVSYDYNEIKTLCHKEYNHITLPYEDELKNLKNEYKNFEISRGTAYKLIGNKPEIISYSMTFPRGEKLNQSGDFKNDFYNIEPSTDKVKEIDYYLTKPKVLELYKTNISFNCLYKRAVVDLKFYSRASRYDVVINNKKYTLNGSWNSNIYGPSPGYIYTGKISLGTCGKFNLTFENECFLEEMWVYDDIVNTIIDEKGL